MKKLTPSFLSLVHILNDGQYHDGTTLGALLNMTRSAVWKMIQKLIHYGVIVDSIKGKGYALLEPLILLNKKIIKQNITAKNIDLDILETVGSTNDYLKNKLSSKQIAICFAEQQTQGRGRMQRSWHSPFGQNIYFSFAYPFQKDVSELAGLSLVVSLAIIKTLETYGLSHPLQVKWPNDILYQGKKISGNLIEVQAESHGISHAIIGIGINVNMMPSNEVVIAQAWTSLRNILGDYIDRNQLCISLIDNLLHYIKQFEQVGLAAYIEEWRHSDYLYNKAITLIQANHKIHGKAMGIDQLGHLLLQLEDGSVKRFSSGDTTIMK